MVPCIGVGLVWKKVNLYAHHLRCDFTVAQNVIPRIHLKSACDSIRMDTLYDIMKFFGNSK